jgi:pyruvate dehydrogenase E2 component (dihydrolipoamide acetyltransferase)
MVIPVPDQGGASEARDFLLPDLGEGLTEAEIVAWLVGVGDEVTVDQPIVEVESAKSVVELPSPFAGRVATLHAETGATVHAGSPLITVLTAAPARPDPTGDPERAPAQTGHTTAGSRAASEAVPAGAAPVEAATPRTATPETTAPSGAVLVGYGTRESTMRLRRPPGARFGKRAPAGPIATAFAAPDAAPLLDPGRRSPVVSPIVRKYARANGLDAGELRGSGPDHLVLRSDVDAAIAALRGNGGAGTASGAGPASGEPGPENAPTDTVIPITGIRRITAERLSHSRTVIPDATVWLDVDATELITARARFQELTGERFSVTTLVARFVVEGLKRFPLLNSSVDEEAGQIIQHGQINLGLAAQTPRGLLVPVVHGAESMTTRQLRDGIQEVVALAGKGDYPRQALTGGTFTLNNYGGFGVDGSSPIINHPEAAMLGLGRIIDRPWVVDGQVVVRKVVVLSIVFDHRVCDGDVASGFLTYVAQRIAEPILLLGDL